MSRVYDPSVNGIRFITNTGTILSEYVGPDYQTKSLSDFLKYKEQIKNGEVLIQTYQVEKTIYIAGAQKQFDWFPKYSSITKIE